MEIIINKEKEIVEVWVTNAEQEDAIVSARLKKLFAKYKNTDYTVAVFKSGKRDVYQGVLDLCRYNRMRAAAARKYRERMAEKPEEVSEITRLESDMDAVVSANEQAWYELAKGPTTMHYPP